MNRSYGGSVHLYLMDPQDGITADNIILSIRAAAARHAPGVVVESVEVSFLPAVINVTVTLRLEGDPQPSERVLTVPLTTYNLYGGTR